MRAAWIWIPLLATSGCGEPDQVPFSAVEQVSTPLGRGAAPMLAIDPSGDRVLSYVTADGRLAIEVTPTGGEPSRAEVTDPLGAVAPHGEAPPQLATAPDGSLYLLYTVGKEVPGQRFPRSALRLVRSEDRGRSWSEPISVNEGERFGSHNFHAVLAGDSGRVYAAWLSSTAGRSSVWLRRSADGGRTWTPAAPIDTGEACPCCRTGLALGPDGSLYVSWRKVFENGARDVVVMRSPDGGATWLDPVRPQADDWVISACPHAGPSLAVDREGVVHLGWWTGKEGSAGVYYGRSEDQGRTFTVRPVAVAASSAPAHVRVQPLGGAVAIAWDDGHGPSPRILLRAATSGAEFGPTLTLSGEGAAEFPVLGRAGDSLVVAWSQQSEQAHHDAARARPDMSQPGAVMALPKVGEQVIFSRRVPIQALLARSGP